MWMIQHLQVSARSISPQQSVAISNYLGEDDEVKLIGEGEPTDAKEPSPQLEGVAFVYSPCLAYYPYRELIPP